MNIIHENGEPVSRYNPICKTLQPYCKLDEDRYEQILHGMGGCGGGEGRGGRGGERGRKGKGEGESGRVTDPMLQNFMLK